MGAGLSSGNISNNSNTYELHNYLIPYKLMNNMIEAKTPSNTYVNSIITIVKGGGNIMRKSHIFDATQYPTVYLTSDIHSDFRKLVQILKGYELISTIIDPYKGDDIYKPELITETEWTGGSNTLFVIIGDLVDGLRRHNYPNNRVKFNAPDDELGIFEFLQFCFLYNLRIRALMQNSDIICTIGNHETTTVLTNSVPRTINTGDLVPNKIDPIIYSEFTSKLYNRLYTNSKTKQYAKILNFHNEYIAKKAKEFYKTSTQREKLLQPFVTHVWPYFMISIMNGDTKEVACVHGGLHYKDMTDSNVDKTHLLETIQTEIDRRESNTSIFAPYFINFNMVDNNSPVWTRFYSSNENGICKDISDSEYSLIVVGHCPTNYGNDSIMPRFAQLKLENSELYKRCDSGNDVSYNRGCVYIDCLHNKPGGPQLAFVDTALSNGQRAPEPTIDNSLRSVECLRLRHTISAPAPTTRFYNIVERVDSSGGIITQLYPGIRASPGSTGASPRNIDASPGNTDASPRTLDASPRSASNAYKTHGGYRRNIHYGLKTRKKQRRISYKRT